MADLAAADLAAIVSVATGLRTAGQIVNSMTDFKIGSEVQAKLIELQAVIMSASGPTKRL